MSVLNRSLVHHIGEPHVRGTYFFHSRLLNGWVVADLDTNRLKVADALAYVTVQRDPAGLLADLLEKTYGLGQDGDRWLVEESDLPHLLGRCRPDHEVLEVHALFRADGGTGQPTTAEREAYERLADFTRKVRAKKPRRGT